MSPTNRLRRALLATVLAAQAAAPAYADARPYVRMQSMGGGGAAATPDQGTSGNVPTTGATQADPTQTGTPVTSPTTPVATTPVVTVPVATVPKPTSGIVTVKQTNTDGSTTTTSTNNSTGSTTSTTTTASGTTTTITKTPATNTNPATVTEIIQTPGGGTNSVTAQPGAISGAGTLRAHVNQPLTGQFSTTSTGTPVWSFLGPAPQGFALDSASGLLSGSSPTVSSQQALVSDGISDVPYVVGIEVVPALDIADARLSLRVGVSANARYAALNVIEDGLESTPSLPSSLKMDRDGSVHGTPNASDAVPATVTVTLHDTVTTDPATGYVTRTFPVTFHAQPLTISDYPDIVLKVGQPVDVPGPTVGGSPTDPSFAISGNLPDGLGFSTATGAITGTPSSVPYATELLTVTVTDSTGGAATTDPFRVGPAVGGTGMASSEYPVLATDFYCTFAHSQCGISFEGYYSQSGDAPRPMFSGMQYTYAHPVVTDGTLDLATADGNTDYVLLYNASTTGDTNWQPVVGTTLASQYLITPSNSNNDYGGGRVLARARIGNAGAFPGWEPYMRPSTAVATVNAPAYLDLSKLMATTDGTAPFTYFVTGLPKGLSYDGAHGVTGTPTVAGNFAVSVSVADQAGIPSAPVRLALAVRSALSASGTYPADFMYYGGDPGWMVGGFYANDPSYAPNSLSDAIIEFAQPVNSDGSTDVRMPNGRPSPPSQVLYDAGNGSLPIGQVDWEPVTGEVTSTRFRLRGMDFFEDSIRVGDRGAFPTLLPHLVDGSASTMVAQAGSRLDLAQAYPPVDGTAPFTYAFSYGLPAGVTFDGAHTLTWASAPAGDYFMHATVSDKYGFTSPTHYLALHLQSNNLASTNYPVSAVPDGAGVHLPTNLTHAENNAPVPSSRDTCCGSWIVTYAKPVSTDGSIDLGGNGTGARVFAMGTAAQVEDGGSLRYGNGFESDYTRNQATPVTPVTGTSFQVFIDGNNGITRMRLGYGGVFPDYLPFMPAPATKQVLQGSAIRLPLDSVTGILDVLGYDPYAGAGGANPATQAPDSYASPDGSVPAGLSINGNELDGPVGAVASETMNLSATDPRAIPSATRSLTLVGTPPGDPSLGGTYAMSAYPDASVRGGKALALAKPTLTGPWINPVLSLSGPTLPAGLAFNPDGSITGTPTADLGTTLAYTVTATDAAGYYATQSFDLVPYGYVSLSDGVLPATYMQAYSGSLPSVLHAVGNTDGARWKVTSGTMPHGVALDVATGALDGVPSAMAATDPMTVQVTSATGMVASAKLDIPVTMWAGAFDGSTNFMTLPDIATTFFQGGAFTGFTVGSWVRPTDNGCWERFFELATGERGWNAIGDGRPYCGGDQLWGYDTGISNGGLLPQGKWTYVALVRDQSSSTIYANGAPVVRNGTSAPASASRPYSWIGRSSYPSDNLFAGQMSDMQFYGRPLSQAELATTQSGDAVTGLVGRYIGSPVANVDTSGSSGNAVANGSIATTPFIPPGATGTGSPPAPTKYAITMAQYPSLALRRRDAVSVAAPAMAGDPVNPAFSVAPALPAGLALNKDGSITGTMAHSLPVSPRSYVVTATDDRGLRTTSTFGITATDPMGIAAYPNLSPGNGDQVSLPAPALANDPETPAFIVVPALDGLTMNADGSVSGPFNPARAGTTNYTVTVTDLVGRTASTAFSVTATPAFPLSPGAVTINWDTNGIDLEARDLMSGSSVPTTSLWTVTGGSLPNGMTMDTSGHLRGYVNVPGIYTAGIEATPVSGPSPESILTVTVPYVVGTFDGNSHMTLPADTSAVGWDANGNFLGLTVTAWVDFTADRGWERVFEFASGYNGQNAIVVGRSGGSNRLFMNQGDGTQPEGGTIVQGAWTHLALTIDPSGNATLYQDGQPVIAHSGGVPANVNRPLSFVGASSWGDPQITGAVGDLQVYNRALAQGQVQFVSRGRFFGDIQDWYLGSIYTTYDMSMRFANPAAHAATVTGSVGQAPFVPVGAPGN